MQTVTIRFDYGQTVFGVRQLCLLCRDGEVKVRSVTNGDEEWWVQCPVCHGYGTHPQGIWVVEEFQVYEINWRTGNWVNEEGQWNPETLYTQMYGDFDRRDYSDELVFGTKEEADKAAEERNRVAPKKVDP